MTSALVILLVAVNPLAVAALLRGQVERPVLGLALAVSGVVAVVAGALSDPVLDVLSVTAPTFRVAAGAVLGLVSAVWLARGPRLLSVEATLLADEQPEGRWPGLVVPLLVPVLITPQLVAVSIAVGADEGVVAVVIGAATALVAAGVAAVLYRGPAGAWSVAARLVGMIGIAVALGMVVDGVKSV